MKKRIKKLLESKDVESIVNLLTETNAGRIPKDGDALRFLKPNTPFSPGDTAIVFSVENIDDEKKVYKLVLLSNGKKVTKEFNFQDVDKVFEFVYDKN